MISISHVVNPFRVRPDTDLFVAQPVTLQTMLAAQAYAREQVAVTLYAATTAAEQDVVPAGFYATPLLTRTVLDLYPCQPPRPLPLLRDILDRLYAASNADYFVYTNIDIALMPTFYTAVAAHIAAGYDAFVINRRTIADHYPPDALPLMYADAGEPHPGHDCFIFRRDVYPRYKLGDVCLGARFVGRVLLWNLVCHAQNFCEFKRQHLTFHLGNDKLWQNEAFADYAAHNEREAMGLLPTLAAAHGPFTAAHPIWPYLADLQMPSLPRRLWRRLWRFTRKT